MPGSCSPKSLDGTPSTTRPRVAVLPPQRFEVAVLRGVAAKRSGVDDQHRPAAPGRERQLAAVDRDELELVGVARFTVAHRDPRVDSCFAGSIARFARACMARGQRLHAEGHCSASPAMTAPQETPLSLRASAAAKQSPGPDIGHFRGRPGCAALLVHRDCRPIDAERMRARMLVGFLLKGVLVGIIIAVPVGPVGVLCIRRTIFTAGSPGSSRGSGRRRPMRCSASSPAFGLTVDFRLAARLPGLAAGRRRRAFCSISASRAFAADPLAGTQTQRDPEDLFDDYASTFALTITNPITILAVSRDLRRRSALPASRRRWAAPRSSCSGCGSARWCGGRRWLSAPAWCGCRSSAQHLVWINRGSGGILVLVRHRR